MVDVVWDLAIGGVNHSIEGNGGPDCNNYLPIWQRVIETMLFVPLSLYGIKYSLGYLEPPYWIRYPFKKISIPSRSHSIISEPVSNCNTPGTCSPPSTPRFLPNCEEVLISQFETTVHYAVIMIYSLVFGAELAFKMISRTTIFVLNPCHITTVMQLVLLTMRNNLSVACVLFRFHMYTIPGAVLALAFPILNTRLLPGEVFIYYVQHILIIVVPLYMIYLEGPFIPESLANVGWPVLSLAILVLYHFTVLQFVGFYTEVNLNCIICPAVSDPLKSRLYRIFAVAHQSLLVPLTTKLYNCVALFLLCAFRSISGTQDIDDEQSSVKKTD